jgi:AcrR family transcriptional regulator
MSAHLPPAQLSAAQHGDAQLGDAQHSAAQLSASGPQSPESMTPGQLARRQRLLDAVLDLIAEGADDEVQMKEIAERSGVALGTVYRYFSSKDHLLAAALVQWASALDERTGRRPLPDGDAAARLSAVLHQALRAYSRQPTFARLLVLVANSSDPYARACYADMRPVVFPALERAIDTVEPDTRSRILAVIGAVWYHCLVEWVNARMTIDDVTALLDSTTELLLAPYAAT